MAWDPAHYLRFADHRARPGLELLARIDHDDPTTVIDLGCGPGNVTTHLAERWPSATVTGIDTSTDMLAQAADAYPTIAWQQGDVAQWEPDGPVDVLYSNAALHWLDDHEALVPRLRSFLAPGGVLAVQMPDSWRNPTHTVPAEILDDGTWPPAARSALLRDRLAAPTDYRRWLQPGRVDLWRTTYFQELTGDDPVWNWTTGSVLGPVLAALADDDRARFTTECQTRYRQAYPRLDDGVTVLPFPRLFMVATAP
ncbi:MAG: methyltransferase domain-containing protein [Actinomycetota bacterium]